MTCANPACGTQSLYLCTGGIHAVDYPGGSPDSGERRSIQRRVIWLCDACSGAFAVEAWRPPREQVQPSRSPRAVAPRDSSESWS